MGAPAALEGACPRNCSPSSLLPSQESENSGAASSPPQWPQVLGTHLCILVAVGLPLGRVVV